MLTGDGLAATPLVRPTAAGGIGCTQDAFPTAMIGNVALIQRGTCNVSDKALFAQQAGLRMLWQGGNAVDAAVAAAAVMTLVEPVSNGLGSDSFCLLWDGQQLHGLNASGRAPQAWTADYFHRKYGADRLAPPERGWDSVTVPGAVASWVALNERFGRLPFGDVLAPAIEIAERGFAVAPITQQKWAAAVPVLNGQPGFADTFMPRGRAPEVG